MQKLVILGFDGLEPSLLARFWARGRCGHLKRLAERGGYRLLNTSTPAESPVAWASFITGAHPGRHGIFDFLHRDPDTYLPKLSIAETRPPGRSLNVLWWKLPLEPARTVRGRSGTPFWHAVAVAGFPVAIVRVPVTYPPEPFNGTLLSSMGVPDLHGSQGTYHYWTTDPQVAGTGRGGDAVLVSFADRTCLTQLRPIPDPFRSDGRPTSVQVTLQRRNDELSVSTSGRSFTLKVGEWSPWIKVTYRFSLGAKAAGLVRFFLSSAQPHLNLYCSPVNLDPEAPVLPISHPPRYAAELERAIGPYATLGMAEDTWVLNERRMDEDGFLASCGHLMDERERMLDFELARFRNGLLVCVFDQPDRMQHMFWRVEDAAHPAHDPALATRYKGVLEALYERLDRIVGRVTSAHPDANLIVMSDHGCKPFRRAFHVNRWLAENGYLAIDPRATAAGHVDDGLYLRSVDLERTRAYALGLSGIYLNLRGRERNGIVTAGAEAERVKRSIAAELAAIRDPADDSAVVNRVLRREEVFNGPATPDAPDLVVCYCAGYRASWQTALGGVPDCILEDNLLAWSGDHCIDPDLVPGVILSDRPLSTQPLHLVDIASSVRAYFGLAPDSALEGRNIWACAAHSASRQMLTGDEGAGA
jgi:predicted AlkP superfamily phosphohydrolase/phosphomutase